MRGHLQRAQLSLVRSTRSEEAIEAYGLPEVLEPVLSSIDEGYPVGSFIADKLVGGLGYDDLPAIARIHEPGRSRHRGPEVVAVLRFSLTRVHAEPDT